ncbi:MAG: methyl-accepting chemotaxis protein [Deltaproteobacteria bacterium HGW-Deltaproteobacteria-6]|nr:MAG: methyl-accepting chemotaxis protein [Deltaproteobacteria bacterium HGW-Deltaproteobacteria-6]
MKKSLRFKMMAGGIIAVFVPLLVVGGFSAYKSMSALEESAQSQSMEVAKGLANMANLVVQEEMKIAAQIAVNDSVIQAAVANNQGRKDSAEAAKAAAELTALIRQSGNEYETIYIAGTDGKIFADGVEGKYKGIDVSDRNYIQTAKSGKVNSGAVMLSKLTGKPVLMSGAPVYSKSKELIGVVGTAVNADFLVDKVAGTKLGKTGYGFAVDKTGSVIAHPKKEFILALNALEQEGMKEFSKKMVAGETGSEPYTFKGVKKMAGFAPVPLAGWGICITQDYNEFMAPAYHLMGVILVIGIIFLVIAVVSVSFFARGIALPIGHVANDLGDASEQVAAASSQVAAASQSLAEGASEQASALEETSSSLEEMSSMTKQNADNAAQARALMGEAKQIVERVDGQMKNMVTAIQEVTRSSEETGKIIKTIDEIAFQTNLLALNAAVEAARAGEAGAGFAVVADEVRNLALRAADAAKNTSNLIENTIVTVKNSRDLTQKTQDAFKENMEIAGKISQLVDEIAAASSEQAVGIGQIGKAVAEMDKVVQQTAANAEESASAAEEMNAQAEQMNGYVTNLLTIVDGTAVQQSVHNDDKPAVQKPGKPMIKKILHAGSDLLKQNRPIRPQPTIAMAKSGFKDF